MASVDVELRAVLEHGKKTRIEKRVTITGELDAAQLERCYEIAGKCPVHRLLVEGAEVISSR